MNIEIQFPAKRNFLTLLVLFFAIKTAFQVIAMLQKCGWISEGILANAIISIIYFVLYTAVLLRLLIHKEYGLTGSSRFGIILLMIHQFQGFTAGAIYIHYPDAYLLLSMTHLAFSIIYIIDIIMFINGSPTDKNLKRFVRWTPFINIIAMSVLVIAMAFAENPNIMFSTGYDLIFTSIGLAVFLTVYKLAQHSVSVPSEQKSFAAAFSDCTENE